MKLLTFIQAMFSNKEKTAWMLIDNLHIAKIYGRMVMKKKLTFIAEPEVTDADDMHEMYFVSFKSNYRRFLTMIFIGAIYWGFEAKSEGIPKKEAKQLLEKHLMFGFER